MRFPQVNRHALGAAALVAVVSGLGFAAGWMSGGDTRTHALDMSRVQTVATNTTNAPIVWKPPAEIAPGNPQRQ